ncbi:MAG: hypothetical protein GY940_00505, partial [bacterium]|nr:hypothetical protein [bacterium]
FLMVLQKIQADAEATGKQFTWMNSPADIALMFDKPGCLNYFYNHGLAVPPGMKEIESYRHLREEMENSGRNRLFVKLAYSSSASGVMAYEINPKTGQEQAYTTIELVRAGTEPVLYNSLKIKRYNTHADIKLIIDWICSEGAHVETWIPKERAGENVFDLRAVIIEQKVCHRVLRFSQSPMTNLHLGNRWSIDIFSFIEESTWRKIEELSRNVAALFPGSTYAGLDIVVPAGGKIPRIL